MEIVQNLKMGWLYQEKRFLIDFFVCFIAIKVLSLSCWLGRKSENYFQLFQTINVFSIKYLLRFDPFDSLFISTQTDETKIIFHLLSFLSLSSFNVKPDDDVQIVQKIENGKQTTVHHAPLTLFFLPLLSF